MKTEFLKIKKITKLTGYGSKRYDIEVKDNHNFFADDILVHNSNFSLWYDGEKLQGAKRSAFLDEDASSFYNAEEIKLALKQKIKALWDYLSKIHTKEIFSNQKLTKIIEPKINQLVLFGELFGGGYNHPNVERNCHAIKVQKEIQYSPSNHFYCFDIKVNGAFVSQDLIEDWSQRFEIFSAQSLFVGSFKECLEYPNAFQTTIPKRLGLPEIENNTCEGVVIKPIIPQYFFNGSRIILKNKNDKFKEKKDKDGKNKAPNVKESFEFSTEGEKMKEEISLYITENRLKNVLSKVGQITDKQFGLIYSQLNQDVMKDFLKDNKDEFTNLEYEERKAIQKYAGALASKLVRTNFLNILDNNF